MADLKKKKKEKCASRFCVALKIVRTKRTREGEEEEGLFFPLSTEEKRSLRWILWIFCLLHRLDRRLEGGGGGGKG